MRRFPSHLPGACPLTLGRAVPFHTEWLRVIGLIFYILNLSLFVLNCTLITLRFIWRPGSFRCSFTDQFESLFVTAFVSSSLLTAHPRDGAVAKSLSQFVSIGTILITTCQYGVPHTGTWLLRVMEVLFWIYIGASTFTSAGMYLILWSTT